MRKVLAVLLLFTFSFLSVNAQEDAQFTLFPWAQLYYNPGSAGEQHNTLCFTAMFRQQYLGYKDVWVPDQVTDATTPEGLQTLNTGGQQLMLNIETYLRKLHGGIGLSVVKDKNGIFGNIGVRLGYSYKVNLPVGRLGIGFQVGFLNQSIDKEVYRPLQPGDPIIELLKNNESFMNLDFNVGLYYKAPTFYVGLSATQLATSIRLSGDNTLLNPSRNMYIHGGYIWTIPWDPAWSIEPQAMVKTNFATAQFDLMLLARYNGILWGGLSYRIDDAASILFGARPFYNSSNVYMKGLDMGLSYSFTTSKLGYKKHRSFGDIELVVRYCFDIYKPEVFTGYGSTRNIYKNQY